jgi:hypothetical protein
MILAAPPVIGMHDVVGVEAYLFGVPFSYRLPCKSWHNTKRHILSLTIKTGPASNLANDAEVLKLAAASGIHIEEVKFYAKEEALCLEKGSGVRCSVFVFRFPPRFSLRDTI